MWVDSVSGWFGDDFHNSFPANFKIMDKKLIKQGK
jgi:hypothetical protein